MLRWSKFAQTRIKEIKEHIKLYKGLICSYPLKNVIQYFINNLNKEKEKSNIDKLFDNYKIKVKYSFINSDNHALPYIKIIFNKVNINNDIKNNHNYIFISESELIYKIEKWMNLCGWQNVDVVDIYSNRLNNNQEYTNVQYIIFRAKFDVEVEMNTCPDYLYHITPFKNINKIKKNGLVPRSENKKLNHADIIYLFNVKNKDELNYLVKELNLHNKYDEFAILKIKIPKNLTYFRLFMDPDLTDSFFTLDNIPPHYIEEIEKIKI